MNYIHINKFSQEPLYLQIHNSIRSAILDGTLKNHDQLPTEEAICRFYGVSRPVVRQAYQGLIKEGLIVRRQGQGSFVLRQVMYSNLPYIDDYEKEFNRLHVHLTNQVLNFERIKVDDVPGIGPLPKEYKSFYWICRIRKGDNIPLLIDNFYFPEHLFPDLEKRVDDLSSFRKIVITYLPSQHYVSDTTLNAVILDDALADLLEVPRNSAGFRYRGWATNAEGRLLIYNQNFFPGDRNQMELEFNQEDL